MLANMIDIDSSADTPLLDWTEQSVSELPTGTAALTARARVTVAQGEPQHAERDLHDAVAVAEHTGGHQYLPDALDGLAALAGLTNPEHSARLFGAAESMRHRHGSMRFKAFQGRYDAALMQVRNALDAKAFEMAWAEGNALSTAEAIAYARRGRGARGHPANGWESLTPTELDVVRLVGEGLPNKDIAARLFISPRTVQSHLTHVYTKLAVSSRVQLAQEAARHS